MKQNGASRLFRGDFYEQNVGVEELYFNYPLDSILANQNIFFEHVKFVYDHEKFRNPVVGKRQFLNLAKPGGISSLNAHLKVHSITGLPELGTSNTVSIPYWDRQAYKAGLEHQFGALASDYLQESDIENINALRSFIGFVAPREIYSRRTTNVLNELLDQGQFTRSDIRHEIVSQSDAWLQLHTNYRKVLIAKLKHALFLIDKIGSRTIRAAALKELDRHITNSEIKSEELQIDLGVDGGVTEDTLRPPYQIHMIKQLRHLGKDELSIPKTVKTIWSTSLLRKSIARFPGTHSLLVEPSEYHLDWNFDGD